MTKIKLTLCILAAVFTLNACGAKDQCLDEGGSYDAASQVCHK